MNIPLKHNRKQQWILGKKKGTKKAFSTFSEWLLLSEYLLWKEASANHIENGNWFEKSFEWIQS